MNPKGSKILAILNAGRIIERIEINGDAAYPSKGLFFYFDTHDPEKPR